MTTWSERRRTSVGVSIIVPTYRRPHALERALGALPPALNGADELEIVIVDDEPSDRTREVADRMWGVPVRYTPTAHVGATLARNFGAKTATGELLIFMDDDMVPAVGALAALIACSRDAGPGAIVLGNVVAPGLAPEMSEPGVAVETVHYTHCLTGLLAIGRRDFEQLGGFRDPSGGWPNWDDVDFGYRAHVAGLRLLRVRDAVAEHWDETQSDLASASARWYRASHAAARLFERHPTIANELPMYRDMLPIAWGQDSGTLVARKVLRRASANRVVGGALMWSARLAGRVGGNSRWTRRLRVWVVGAHMARGLADGRRDVVEGKRSESPA